MQGCLVDLNLCNALFEVCRAASYCACNAQDVSHVASLCQARRPPWCKYSLLCCRGYHALFNKPLPMSCFRHQCLAHYVDAAYWLPSGSQHSFSFVPLHDDSLLLVLYTRVGSWQRSSGLSCAQGCKLLELRRLVVQFHRLWALLRHPLRFNQQPCLYI